MKTKDFAELETVFEQFVDRNETNIEYVQKDYSYKVPDIDSYEKWCIRKVSIISNKLKRHRISSDYDPSSMTFRVQKYRYKMSEPTEIRYRRTKSGGKGKVTGDNSHRVYDEYPTVQHIAFYEDGTYGFGGDEEDLFTSSRISEVISYVEEWLGNNEGGAR